VMSIVSVRIRGMSSRLLKLVDCCLNIVCSVYSTVVWVR